MVSKIIFLAFAVFILCIFHGTTLGQHQKKKVVKSTSIKTKSDYCTLKTAQSLTLRGFHLGMSLDEVKKKYPTVQFSLKPRTFERLLYGVAEYLDYVIVDADMSEDEFVWQEPFLLYTIFTKIDTAKNLEFADTDKIELYFAGNKLTRIKIYYSNSTWWKDFSEFSETVKKKLELPESSYGFGSRVQNLATGREGSESYEEYLCQEFQIQLIMGYSAKNESSIPIYTAVILSDENAEATEQRKQYKVMKEKQKLKDIEMEKERKKKRDIFKP